MIPSISVKAEPPVALVDGNAQADKAQDVASYYLQFLYSEAAQDIAARNYYRPSDPAVLKRYGEQFPALSLVTIDSAFGGWDKAQAQHFADGGVFDQLYKPE